MVVLYDRDCGFCAWTLGWLLRWDRGRRLRPAPIQGPEGARLLADIAPQRRLASWHAVDAAGTVWSGGAALPEVLRRLPGGGPLARVIARVPRATDRAYRWVAAHRVLLGRPLRPGAKARARELITARAAPQYRDALVPQSATCALPAGALSDHAAHASRGAT